MLDPDAGGPAWRLIAEREIRSGKDFRRGPQAFAREGCKRDISDPNNTRPPRSLPRSPVAAS